MIVATRARNGSARPRGGPAEDALELLDPKEDGGSRTRPSPGGSRAGTASRSGSRGRASTTSGSTTTRSPAPRGTSGKPGRGTQPRSGQKKKVGAGEGPYGEGPSPKGAASRDPVVILIGWTGRTIAAAWMVAAGAVGFAARAIGRGARDLDPHHRRDGLGLLTLGVAVVLAASLWERMGNTAGRAIYTGRPTRSAPSRG